MDVAEGSNCLWSGKIAGFALRPIMSVCCLWVLLHCVIESGNVSGESQPDQIWPVRKNMVSVKKTKKYLTRFGGVCFNSCAH